MTKTFNWTGWTTAILFTVFMATGVARAQLPPQVEAELRKLGPVVEPGCTAKLMRPLFPPNDYNTYWPVDSAMPNTKVTLYPGINLARDVKFGDQAKDLVDIFSSTKGPANRTVLIYVPGGAGNKLEQQSVEANMFYDNIGRWAAENGMVGVTLQRSATNIPVMIEWLKANIAKYKGNPDSMVIWAHSAGNGPLGNYIGRPDLYGISVKGALFMSGNPVTFGGAGGRGGGGGGRGAAGGAAPGAAPAAGAAGGRGGAAAGGGAAQAGGRGGGGGFGGGGNGVIGTSTCTNTAGAGSQAGVIRGPSSQIADQGAGAAAQRAALAATSPWKWDGKQWVSTGATSAPAAAAPAGAGAGGGRGGGAPAAGAGAGGGGRGGGGAAGAGGGRGGGAAPAAGADAAAAPAFTNQDGFRSTRVKIALAWAELDTGASAGMPTASVAVHDELCKLEGPKPKDGVGHCPTMMWFKGESHMSEVFSLGSIDKTVSGPVLAWIKSLQ